MRAIARGARLKEAEESTRREWGMDDSLMTEHAARSVLEAMLEWRSDWGSGLVVACGRGGNGGDGLALAALAARRGLPVSACVLLPGPLSARAAFRLDMAKRSSIPVYEWESASGNAASALRGAGILLDAVAGIGLSGRLKPEAASLCELWNALEAPKVALDMPSGLCEGWRAGYPLFRADLTVSIGLPSLPLYLPSARPLCGSLRIVNGGVFPEKLLRPRQEDPVLLEDEDFAVPPLDPDAGKFERGRLAVFAGSPDGAGAALLCARSAARAGAGLVDLAVDAVLWAALAPAAGGIRLRAVPEDAEGLERIAGGRTVLAGPGWGRDDGRRILFERLASMASALVADADALNVLAEKPLRLPERSILTPQPNEGARLLGIDADEVKNDPASAALSISRRYGAVTVLKGPITFVASPDGGLAVWEGRMGELGTGGSGDVLAGIAAGLLARGLEAREAARQAVILHARAAERARRERGVFLAEELCECLSHCIPSTTEVPRGR